MNSKHNYNSLINIHNLLIIIKLKMGCSGSTDVLYSDKKNKGLVDIDDQSQWFCLDSLMIEEVIFVRQLIHSVTKSPINYSHPIKHKQKIDYLKVDADFLKRLYRKPPHSVSKIPLRIQPDQNQTTEIQHQTTKTPQMYTPQSNDKIQKQHLSNHEHKIRTIPQEQNLFDNLVVFMKNGLNQNASTFLQFIKQYALLIRTDPTSPQWAQVLHSLISKGNVFISQVQFKKLFQLAQIPLQELQQQFLTQQPSSEFIIPTLMDKQLFAKTLSVSQKSSSHLKKWIKFQSMFDLLGRQSEPNKQQSIMCAANLMYLKQYSQVRELLIQEQINSGNQDVDQKEVYVVSKKRYEHFVQIFYDLLQFTHYRTPNNQNQSPNKRQSMHQQSINQSSMKQPFSNYSSKNSPNMKKYALNNLKNPRQNSITNSKNKLNPYIQFNQLTLSEIGIEGQYRLELRADLQQNQFKTLSYRLFKAIDSLLKSSSYTDYHSNWTKCQTLAFPRKIIPSSSNHVSYFPLHIYLLRTSKSGAIDSQTQQELLIQSTTTLEHLKLKYFQSIKQKVSFFSKIFQEKNFREQTDHTLKIQQLHVKRKKLVIVITENRLGFIDKNNRKQITKQNLTIGDKVYALFDEQHEFIPAFIINRCEARDQIRIHFIGKSWRDQQTVSVRTVNLKPTDISNQNKRPQNYQQLFTGLKNVGNTCYINSSIQCLYSTSLLSDLLPIQPINKSWFTYIMVEIFKSLSILNSQSDKLSGQKMTQIEFKEQMSTKFLKQFDGWLQHDAQQFIHSTLDKLAQEQKDLIGDIFKFKIQNQLICADSFNCGFKKNNFQTMSMITLPIPEPKWVYVQVLMIPIYSQKIQKIVIKLQKNASLGELLRKFQERSGSQRAQFTFVETENGDIKKLRKDISHNSNQQILISQLGMVSNVKLAAYQTISEQKMSQMIKAGLRLVDRKNFHDFFIKEKKIWTIARILPKGNDYMTVQYVNQLRQIVKVKISKVQIANQSYLIQNLGVKTLVNEAKLVKIYMRKPSKVIIGAGKTMQNFGIQSVASLPLWCSYNDAVAIVNQQIKNFKNNAHIQKDYIVRLLEQKRQKCIFCQKQIPKNYQSEQDIKRCCKVFQADVPLSFVAKQMIFVIYIDWKTLQNYNSEFCTMLTMDRACKSTEEQLKQQRISLHQCFKMLTVRQQVEMKCDKCKHPRMFRQESISTLPPILIIQLKQYRYAQGSQTMVKININLNYSEVIQISVDEYLPEKALIKRSLNYDPSYELYSVIQHVGSGNSGHYTALCRRRIYLNQSSSQYKQVWVHFDDDFAQIIEESSVNNFVNNAYMLFYRKKFLPVWTRLKLELL